MKLGKLYESFTTPDIDFIRQYQTEDLSGCKTLNETKETVQSVFDAADKYATDNNLQYTYFQLAKTPLWENMSITPQHFILKGFDAYINVDLTEALKDIKPFVVVQNKNVDDLKNGQRIEIDEAFIKSLIPLQKEIFLEALKVVENEAMEKMSKVWVIEKQRIDKWVKTCKINLKGNQ